MRQYNRRSFLKGSAVAGAGSLAAALSGCGEPSRADGPQPGFTGLELPLSGRWSFRPDPEQRGEQERWCEGTADEAGYQAVTVPHTWQVLPGLEEYRGLGWYHCRFEAQEEWRELTVRAEFAAVFHSARVWLNGAPVGEHLRKGYTAFALDLSPLLRYDAENLLTVQVDNRFDPLMLPRDGSFDWNNDGGIIRPVSLLVTPPAFIEQVHVTARPDLDRQVAELRVRAFLANSGAQGESLVLRCRVRDDSGRTVLVLPEARATLAAGELLTLELPPSVLEAPRLWHFDQPQLYRLEAELAGGELAHRFAVTFGVRRLEVREGGFVLNGEPVRLMGVERMGGSHPEHGMAETAEWIERDHRDMRELNCIFTRTHWPQDRRVLDCCDRLGIMIQTEVPAWGPDTWKGMQEEPLPEIMQNGLEQLREMIHRDYNHPSLVVWGLCNETAGQLPASYKFTERLLQEARQLDPHRLYTYASNSLRETPEKDVAGLMDFIEFNEYYGSWYEGGPAELEQNLELIHRAFPDKPIVISEYGFCQCHPTHQGGDQRTIEVLLTHDQVFRRLPYLGGLIFFCYNDYRTHIGDKGLGALRQRVHGVVDLYGRKKGSWQVLREESSPAERLALSREQGVFKCRLAARDTLPTYRLRGYRLRWVAYLHDGFDYLPLERGELELPELAPGGSLELELPPLDSRARLVELELARPTGGSVLSARWQD